MGKCRPGYGPAVLEKWKGAQAMGISDVNKKLTMDDLVKGDDVIFFCYRSHQRGTS